MFNSKKDHCVNRGIPSDLNVDSQTMWLPIDSHLSWFTRVFLEEVTLSRQSGIADLLLFGDLVNSCTIPIGWAVVVKPVGQLHLYTHMSIELKCLFKRKKKTEKYLDFLWVSLRKYAICKDSIAKKREIREHSVFLLRVKSCVEFKSRMWSIAVATLGEIEHIMTNVFRLSHGTTETTLTYSIVLFFYLKVTHYIDVIFITNVSI